MYNIFYQINNLCKKLTFGIFSNYKIYYDETYEKYFAVYKNSKVICKNIPGISDIILSENPKKIEPYDSYYRPYNWVKSQYNNLKDEIKQHCFVDSIEKAKEICENHKEFKKYYVVKKKIKFISYE
jgi:hypothetical protein